MRVFGPLDVRLDPWQVDYGPEHPLEPSNEPTDEVFTDLELAAADWRPLVPRTDSAPPAWLFIDGVRRAEARVVIRRPEGICHGVFGSYAVGSVRVEDGAARFGESRVGRLAVLGSGHTLPHPVPVDGTLCYEPSSVTDHEPEAPLRGVHNAMRDAEEGLARALAGAGQALAILDGPLSFAQPPQGWSVGYIKRLHRVYIPDTALGVLAALTPGTRSPMMALRASRRFARYSWFIRLAPAQAQDSDLAGIVRLEVAENIGLDEARRLADMTAVHLPAFVPSRGRDPRAPQNLLPIGALERHLRHLLGDAALIHRRIQALIAREAAVV